MRRTPSGTDRRPATHGRSRSGSRRGDGTRRRRQRPLTESAGWDGHAASPVRPDPSTVQRALATHHSRSLGCSAAPARPASSTSSVCTASAADTRERPVAAERGSESGAVVLVVTLQGGDGPLAVGDSEHAPPCAALVAPGATHRHRQSSTTTSGRSLTPWRAAPLRGAWVEHRQQQPAWFLGDHGMWKASGKVDDAAGDEIDRTVGGGYRQPTVEHLQ
jgi:hypothetical protein